MKKNGLFGKSLSHSISPDIHRYIYNLINYDATYELIEFEENKLKENIDNIRSKEINVNITIPYKEKVIPFLDEIDDVAKKIGAVNTILSKNNVLKGYNTDYYGIHETLKQYDISGKIFLVLGFGGAAKTIIQYLVDNNAKKVYIASRTPEKYKSSFKKYTNINYNEYKHKFVKKHEAYSYEKSLNSAKTFIEFISYNKLDNICGFAIINATPVGMFPNIDGCPVCENIISNFKLAFDLIYAPNETKFLKLAKSLNLITINGLKMLIFQAIKAIEIWTNKEIDDNQKNKIFLFFETKKNSISTYTLDNPVNEELKIKKIQNSASNMIDIQNDKPVDNKLVDIDKLENKLKLRNEPIYIIGLPGAGKTTLGKALSEKLGYEFVDLDAYIESKSNMKISEIFLQGEDIFREVEKKALFEVSKKRNTIIATGGGIVTLPENRIFLSDKPNIIYVDRDCINILSDVNLQNRPLLKDNPNKIFEIFNKRKDYYNSLCTYYVKNDSSLEELVENTLKILKDKY